MNNFFTVSLKPLVGVAAMFTNYSALPLGILNLQGKPPPLTLFLLLDPLRFVVCLYVCAVCICV